MDLKENTWVQLRTNGQPPLPRFGHTLSFVNKQLIIFGGWSINSGRKFNEISTNDNEKKYMRKLTISIHLILLI